MVGIQEQVLMKYGMFFLNIMLEKKILNGQNHNPLLIINHS
jgi:hypothetical protein